MAPVETVSVPGLVLLPSGVDECMNMEALVGGREINAV